ncbi:Peroxinectin A [Elsinoe australis]|uniref:Peroxinectin A n=1 Tax=Elsinoe australis TaxID=40998 RepID=A0A2P7ZZY2_9PEZI|nr:Peroxinectin A [Elsinoe australis]
MASEQDENGAMISVRGLLESVPHLSFNDVSSLLQVGKASALDQPLDDREYLMEKTIQAAVDDENGLVGKSATKKFVKELRTDLQHPPGDSLAKDLRFRKADGSGNSILNPRMGAAGQAYARTVEPKTVLPAVQPDPGLLFDTLMVRRTPQEHPAKLSSIAPYLAGVIIHDIFRTNHTDHAYSDTSSYLDLAPLYGSNEAELARVRLGKDGKLKPDCFSETRLLALPPGHGVLLVMFNRFHNSVAERLIAINEGGRFVHPQPQNKDEVDYVDDEEVFQTARLITCGLYVNIILGDYVRVILNLNRTNSTWRLDPRMDTGDGLAKGVGNQVSAEFNLVYRWHAIVSDRDDKWTQAESSKLFDGQSLEEISLEDLMKGLKRQEGEAQRLDPEHRTFGGFARSQDGYFNDDDLVRSLTESIDDCANAFGPRQVPAVLRAVEILGIRQARAWNLATLNEFRKHFFLKPHKVWTDITEDPETAAHLQHLYGHVDHVELYPGLVVEDAKSTMVPGSGLCPPYTISRALLADAVALTRGDRFHTTSYNARAVTNWGYAEAGYDELVDNGCVAYKLIQRAFPNHFHDDSAFVHYPLTVRRENERIFKETRGLREKAHLYDFGNARTAGTVWHFIDSADAMSSIFTRSDVFGLDLDLICRLLSPSTVHLQERTSTISQRLLRGPCYNLETLPPRLQEEMRDRLEHGMAQLLNRNHYALPGYNEVDVVHDLITPCCVRLAMQLFSIPTQGNSNGVDSITERDLDYVFATIYGSLIHFDRVTLTGMRHKSSTLVTRLRKTMLPQLHADWQEWRRSTPMDASSDDASTLFRRQVFSSMGKDFSSNDEDEAVVDTLFIATMVMAACLSMTLSSRLSGMLDAYLKQNKPEVSAWRDKASKTLAGADDTFSSLLYDLSKASSTAVSVRQVQQSTIIRLGPEEAMTVTPGDHLLISSRLISQNQQILGSGTSTMPVDLIIGPQDQHWQNLYRICEETIMKKLLGLKGLRPAKVWNGSRQQTSLKKVPAKTGQSGSRSREQSAYLDKAWTSLWPVPTSSMVDFDGE